MHCGFKSILISRHSHLEIIFFSLSEAFSRLLMSLKQEFLIGCLGMSLVYVKPSIILLPMSTVTLLHLWDQLTSSCSICVCSYSETLWSICAASVVLCSSSGTFYDGYSTNVELCWSQDVSFLHVTPLHSNNLNWKSRAAAHLSRGISCLLMKSKVIVKFQAFTVHRLKYTYRGHTGTSEDCLWLCWNDYTWTQCGKIPPDLTR